MVTAKPWWIHNGELVVEPPPNSGNGNGGGNGGGGGGGGRGGGWTGRGGGGGWGKGGKNGGGGSALGDVAATRVLTPTSTGLSDVTIPGLGFTPIAARFIITRATTDAVANVHTALGYGATDGTNQWSVCYQSQNGSVNTINSAYGSNLHCLTVQTGGSSTIEVQATIDSFIADGVRLNFTTVDATRFLLTVILYGGSTFANAQAGVITANSTSPVTESVGFPPNVVYSGLRIQQTFDEANQNFDISRGFAAWDGTTLSQCSARHYEAGSDNSPSPTIRVMNSKLDSFWSVSNFTTTSFDATISGGATPAEMGYLALEVPSGKVKAEIVDSPIATGVQSLGSTTFEPKYCSLLLTAAQSLNSDIGTADGGPVGMAEITPVQSYCNSTANESTTGNTNTQTLSDDQAINLPYDDGSVFYEGTLDGFTSTGVDVNLTQAGDGTARKWPALFIG